MTVPPAKLAAIPLILLLTAACTWYLPDIPKPAEPGRQADGTKNARFSAGDEEVSIRIPGRWIQDIQYGTDVMNDLAGELDVEVLFFAGEPDHHGGFNTALVVSRLRAQAHAEISDAVRELEEDGEINIINQRSTSVIDSVATRIDLTTRGVKEVRIYTIRDGWWWAFECGHKRNAHSTDHAQQCEESLASVRVSQELKQAGAATD